MLWVFSLWIIMRYLILLISFINRTPQYRTTFAWRSAIWYKVPGSRAILGLSWNLPRWRRHHLRPKYQWQNPWWPGRVHVTTRYFRAHYSEYLSTGSTLQVLSFYALLCSVASYLVLVPPRRYRWAKECALSSTNYTYLASTYLNYGKLEIFRILYDREKGICFSRVLLSSYYYFSAQNISYS